MDNVHLNPFSLSVDNSDLLEAFLLTFEKIVLEERRDFLGRESVKIDPVLDGNLKNHKRNVKFQNPKLKGKNPNFKFQNLEFKIESSWPQLATDDSKPIIQNSSLKIHNF
jgi:hypothetical protein